MDNFDNLLNAIASLQNSVTALQTNMPFILGAIAELKAEKSENRSNLDKFAISTRDRIKVVETRLAILFGGCALLAATILTIGMTRMVTVLSTENHQVIEPSKK